MTIKKNLENIIGEAPVMYVSALINQSPEAIKIGKLFNAAVKMAALVDIKEVDFADALDFERVNYLEEHIDLESILALGFVKSLNGYALAQYPSIELSNSIENGYELYFSLNKNSQWNVSIKSAHHLEQALKIILEYYNKIINCKKGLIEHVDEMRSSGIDCKLQELAICELNEIIKTF